MLIDESGSVNLKGTHIAQVVSNFDPKCQERVLVRVMGLHDLELKTLENAVWAHHCSPTRDACGELPEEDDYIYVIFPNEEDPMYILWIGFVRSSYQEGREKTAVEETEYKELGA